MSALQSGKSLLNVAGAGLRVPDSLRGQLLSYRRRVWTIKLLEAFAMAISGACAAILCVYAWERIVEMPLPLRLLFLLSVLTIAAVVPWFTYRWVWRNRGLEPLARLLGKQLPAVGDRLLGVLELSHNTTEQQRSPALCQAAMTQVADDAAKRNFGEAVPPSRYAFWSFAAGVTFVAVAVLAVRTPEALSNAIARLAMPWADVPRYTFTRWEPLPDELIIPLGEPTPLTVRLTSESRWQPPAAELTIGGRRPIGAKLQGDEYTFMLPPQIEPEPMMLSVGDGYQAVDLRPTLRPELTSISAEVQLPEYLQRDEPMQMDLRGGSLAAVSGSHATIRATASRDLAFASINESPRPVRGAVVSTDSFEVDDAPVMTFQWEDQWGLAGGEPFELAVRPEEDRAPRVMADGLARQIVVLDSELVKFELNADDDFGVRRVGMMWRGLGSNGESNALQGERVLAAGAPDAESVTAQGTFSAKTLKIQPQPLELFVWSEDYLPGRNRTYSSPYVIYVLTPEEHAVWITEQLTKWQRQTLDVRDRERQLHEANKELRSLPSDQLDTPERRRDIERQASEERANGRRLDRLGETGKELMQNAMRNPEIDPDQMELLAESLGVLQNLAKNRMPSVAELLQQSADAPPSSSSASNPSSASGDPSASQQSSAGGQESSPSESGSGESSPGTPSPSQPSSSSGESQSSENASPPSGSPSSSGAPSEPSDLNTESPFGGSEPTPGSEGSSSEKDDPSEKDPDRSIGTNRNPSSGGGSEGESSEQPSLPQIVDVESSMDSSEEESGEEPSSSSPSSSSPPKFGLPSTTLQGEPGSGGGSGGGSSDAQSEKLDQAVEEQQDLLAEFDRLADQFNAVLANLEGSTLVKRLKAASREQFVLAGKLNNQLENSFGRPKTARPEPTQEMLQKLRETEEQATQNVSYIIDDLAAYFQRRPFEHFEKVLDEMSSSDVVGQMRALADDVQQRQGLSVAQAEFWADTLDRWAEMLVEASKPAPPSSGAPSPPADSLPPAIVLAVMQILDGEVGLREETRVAKQARDAVSAAEHVLTSLRLADAQTELSDKMMKVIDDVQMLPNGAQSFGKELQLFNRAYQVMKEVDGLLREGETTTATIAAETEVIELLLQSNRNNPSGGGGGGGGSPGGGGSGNTSQSALALLGRGGPSQETQQDSEATRSTGKTGRVLPPEFRQGLDQYFNRLVAPTVGAGATQE